MIEGNGIRLRAWQDNDLPVLTLLRNDVVIQGQLLTRPRGSSLEQVRNWLMDRSVQGDKLFFIVADKDRDVTLGFVQINDLEAFDRRAELGICLVREAQGRGIGSESLRLICSYLRKTLGLRKISLKVRVDNEAAISCYRKAGFDMCGLLREHIFIDGSWKDIVLMEKFLEPIR